MSLRVNGPLLFLDRIDAYCVKDHSSLFLPPLDGSVFLFGKETTFGALEILLSFKEHASSIKETANKIIYFVLTQNLPLDPSNLVVLYTDMGMEGSRPDTFWG